MSAFDDAFEILVGHEGGYVNDPNDPGGETKYGISKRSYPAENIGAMTLDRAKTIYKRDFWDKARCDELDPVLAFQVFDAAVNSGVSASVKWLQQAAGAVADGAFGPNTMRAVQAIPAGALAARMTGWRLLAMTDMRGWRNYSKGWARRLGKNLVGMA